MSRKWFSFAPSRYSICLRPNPAEDVGATQGCHHSIDNEGPTPNGASRNDLREGSGPIGFERASEMGSRCSQLSCLCAFLHL